MKVLSFILVSALVFSATANPELKKTFEKVVVLAEIFAGFTVGLKFSDLNPTFQNCSIAINATHTAAFAVDAAMQSEEPEVFERAVATFGYNFAHSIRVCGHAKQTMAQLIEVIATEVKELNRTVLSERLFANLFPLNMKYQAIKTSYQNQDFKAVGEALAEVFKMLVYNTEAPRTVRQLGEFTKFITPGMIVDINATVLGVLGFIEEANTTIAVNDYLTMVNDTTTLVAQLPILEAAIEAFDFQAIISAVNTISKMVRFVGTDVSLIQQEAIAFYQRDIQLFNSEEKITKAVESLFWDLPTTIKNINRITNSYKIGDYRELGHGSGGVYNQLRNGAIGK